MILCMAAPTPQPWPNWGIPMAMEHPPFMVINGDLMGFHGGWMGSNGD